MKHLQTPVLAVCGAVCMLLGSCESQSKKEQQEAGVEAKVEKVNPPRDLISLKEAKGLYDNYTINRVPIIEAYEAKRESGESFVVGRYASFDFETIKQYVSYVEHEADKAGVEVESLRFYFSNKPDAETYAGREVVHPRQNGIFILPTLNDKERDQELGFYIGADGKAQLIRDWSASQKDQASLKDRKQVNTAEASLNPLAWIHPMPLQGDGSLILNFSQSGPPPPDDF
jgi:hypothetical protein